MALLLFFLSTQIFAYSDDSIFDPPETYSSEPKACYPDEERMCRTPWPWERNLASGIVSTNVSGIDTARGINMPAFSSAPSNNETILVFGHTNNSASLAIVKLRFDGTLSPTFNTAGKYIHDISSQEDLLHGLYGHNPAYFVGRSMGESWPMKQVLGKIATNALDTTFNTSGVLITNLTGKDEFLRAVTGFTSAGIVASGYVRTATHYDFLMAAYTSRGTLDTTFNTTGWRTTAMSAFDNGALAIGGRYNGVSGALHPIVAAGPVYNGADWDFGVAQYTTDGLLDTAFNTAGVRVFNILASDDKPYALYLEQNQQVLIAGYTNNGADFDFALARVTLDGRIDTSFHTDGKSTTAFFAGADVAFGVFRNSFDGTIYAVGSADNGGNVDIALARYSSNGLLDSSFHTDGRATFDIAGQRDVGKALRLTPFSNAIYIAAEVGNGDSDFALIRLETDGTLAQSSEPQKSFGPNGNGIITYDISGNDTVAFIGNYTSQIRSYGVGMSGSHFALFYTMQTAGANPGAPGRGMGMDTSFNTRGFIEMDAGGGPEVFRGAQSEIRFGELPILVGNNATDWLITRSNNGTVTTSFDTDGWKTLDFSGNDVAYATTFYDASSNFVVGGRDGNTPSNMVLANIKVDGSLSTAFFTTGYRTLTPSVNSSAAKFVEYRNPNLVVAGDDTQDILLYFMNFTSGALHTSFSTSGLRIADFGGTETFGGAVLNTAGHNIIFAGGNGSDFVLGKVFLTNGNFDTSFNTNGKLTLDFGTTAEMGRAVQPERYAVDGGKLYVAGDDGTNFLLARIHPDGRFDTSFHTDGKRAYPLTGASTMTNMYLNNNVDICMAGSTNANADAVILCVNP